MAIAASMAVRAVSETYGSPLSTRETVPLETPASAATSKIVARFGRGAGGVMVVSVSTRDTPEGTPDR
ncbi:hypothetical protein GCM10009792_10580 [Microcella alkalica]